MEVLAAAHVDLAINSMVIFHSWWYTYPSENCEFVSWDDEIPN